MIPTKVTRDNYTTTLVRSTQGREGVPDGNVFIDTANDAVQLIDVTELAQVNLGSGLEDNPLTNVTKIQSLALYFFLLQEVEADTALQNFRFQMDAVANRMGKLVGATAFLSGIKLAEGTVNINGVGGSLGDDRLKTADSGFTEFAAGSGGNVIIDRVLHGAKSLNPINATSLPFYLLADSLSEADRQAALPVDFSKTGDINEIIQTFGTTANGDTGAGDFDKKTSVLILNVRDFGFEIAEADSLSTGVAELGAYSQGYGIGNPVVGDLSEIVEADVWGGAQIAPYTGLDFTRLTVAATETGFNELDGDFTDRITNSGGATLIQIRAWLDMLMQQDTDENTNTVNTGVFRPKRAEPLYTINAAGKLVTRQGLFIENVPAADEQSIIFTDDSGDQKTRPFNVGIVILLSAAWFNDTAQLFRFMYYDGAGGLDFDTSSAVTATDSSSIEIAGDSLDARITPEGDDYKLSLSYAYDSNTEAGLNAGEDKLMALRIGGGTTSKSKTIIFTITRTSQINVDATTEAETN